MSDVVLMLLLEVLLLTAAVLKLALWKKQGKQVSRWTKLQVFLFPGAFLLAMLCFLMGKGDWCVPVILLGILEEILCWSIRKKGDSDHSSSGKHSTR